MIFGTPGFRTPALVAGALALSVAALPATAATGKSKGKAAHYVVTVTNHRPSAVQSLIFTGVQVPPAAPAAGSGNVLKTPLKSGATVKATVTAPAGQCSFVVSGQYEDGTEIYAEGLDLCADRTLSLVD